MNLKKPLIGISASEIRPARMIRQIKEGEPLSREVALGLHYVDAVTDAGGLAVVLPPGEGNPAAELLDRIEGLCISGGPDIDPATYGAEPHSCLGPVDPVLDRFEIELVRGAIERDMPLLAICRGMQVLNVSLGGTLIQHLPDSSAASLDHRQEMPGDQASHQVELEDSSHMAAVIGSSSLAVNTFHHQAVDRLGNGLVAAGWADDGLIEAVELPGCRYAFGVQWHAELMVEQPAGTPFFTSLVGCAREYGQVARVHA